MEWSPFRHPDFCPVVARRRLTLELLDLLDGVGTFLATRGRSLGWNEGYPSRDAYYSAQYRLKKAGLVAYRRSGGRTPVLALTAEGRRRLPEVLRPQRRWDRKWRGRWHVLVYDVPESEKVYRDTLRRFLKRMRMGRLQESVWVAAHDIRPEYDDLEEAAGVETYSYLCEARMVLGRTDDSIVRDAWNTDVLRASQAWYCGICKENLGKLRRGASSRAVLTSLLREEMSAYLEVMDRDPLLPRALWPTGYRGEEAFRLHRAFQEAIGRLL